MHYKSPKFNIFILHCKLLTCLIFLIYNYLFSIVIQFPYSILHFWSFWFEKYERKFPIVKDEENKHFFWFNNIDLFKSIESKPNINNRWNISYRTELLFISFSNCVQEMSRMVSFLPIFYCSFLILFFYIFIDCSCCDENLYMFTSIFQFL